MYYREYNGEQEVEMSSSSQRHHHQSTQHHHQNQQQHEQQPQGRLMQRHPEESYVANETVTKAFQALLTDLQNTTEVLKRTTSKYDYQESIYEPQQVKMTHAGTTTLTATHRGLQDLEAMVDDIDRKRRPEDRPTVESLLDTLDSAMPNGDHRRQDRPVSASSASKDLDDLMASLQNFKVKNSSSREQSTATAEITYSKSHEQAVVEPSYAKPVKAPRSDHPVQANQLDSMLGTLQADMSSKHGINTIPKGDCGACQKAIVGQVVIALGRMWHPEHFACSHCGDELGHRNFFERSGKAYCETDYHNLFSPRCAYCNGPIKDKIVTALDRTWHPEHFFCAQCGKEFGDEGFHEKDGKAYCRADYFTSFAPRCRGCERPIQSNYITALNTHWHPECFVCADCKISFGGGSFFDHDGRPYCETHYHEKRGSLCAACRGPISGRCVTAMGRKFHPEHFICSYCQQQLNKGTFKEHKEKPYCHQCFVKLFS